MEKFLEILSWANIILFAFHIGLAVYLDMTYSDISKLIDRMNSQVLDPYKYAFKHFVLLVISICYLISIYI